MKRLIVACLMLASATNSAAAQREKSRAVRVFVVQQTEDTNGFVDEVRKRRIDSRRDLIEKLKDDKRIELIELPDRADVLLELADSRWMDFGTRTRQPGLFGTSSTVPDTDPTIRVNLFAGTYKNEIIGRGGRTWNQAANAAARQIKKWIKDNQRQLIAKNP